MAGVTRSPFTAIVFAFELTHDQNSILALLVVATVAHLVSVLVLKRSILTEKVARRGFHVMREYAVDPLEATFVREVMDTDIYTVEPTRLLSELYQSLPEGSHERRQRLYPVLDNGASLVGVLPGQPSSPERTRPAPRPARPWSPLLSWPIPTRFCAAWPTGWQRSDLASSPSSIAPTLIISADSLPSSTFSRPAKSSSKKSVTPNEC